MKHFHKNGNNNFSEISEKLIMLAYFHLSFKQEPLIFEMDLLSFFVLGLTTQIFSNFKL